MTKERIIIREFGVHDKVLKSFPPSLAGLRAAVEFDLKHSEHFVIEVPGVERRKAMLECLVSESVWWLTDTPKRMIEVLNANKENA